MHLLLYVDTLSLTICHAVPLNCTAFHSILFLQAIRPSQTDKHLWPFKSSVQLIATISSYTLKGDVSRSVGGEREKRKTATLPPWVLHQRWHCWPRVLVSLKIVFNVYVSGSQDNNSSQRWKHAVLAPTVGVKMKIYEATLCCFSAANDFNVQAALRDMHTDSRINCTF